MNDEYKSVYRQADRLRQQFRALLDDSNASEARTLYSGLDQLAENFEMQKSPRSLEEMAKRLSEEFKQANSQPVEFMDPRHLNDFKNGLEQIAHEVRKFSNYQ